VEQVPVSGLTFGLLAVVKDEEKSIVQMLESCIDVGIRHWYIQDTGSTDGTPELIAHLSMDANVKARLDFMKWKDFSSNRNENIDRAFETFPEVDYWLALDADETVVSITGPPKCYGRLGMYHLPEKMMNEDPQIVFQAPRLIKGGSDFRYRGRCHEVLYSPTVQPIGLTDGWHLYHWDTGRYSVLGDKARCERNLALLKLDMKDPKADKARTLFYMAMTLERGGHTTLAIDYFGRRAKLKATWEEERWTAHHRLACCQLRLGRPEGVDSMLRVIAERPWRAEPLIDLAAFYKGQGLEQLAMMFLPQGPFPYPLNDSLFLREELYMPRPLTGEASSVTP
jgi:Glycosyl transferase family 2